MRREKFGQFGSLLPTVVLKGPGGGGGVPTAIYGLYSYVPL